MLIIGDVLHNFADGMAVGVGFDVNVGTGIATSIAIAFHELPHEFCTLRSPSLEFGSTRLLDSIIC